MSETNQAYISRVHLKGYKSIRDMAIDFKPGLNIIIGPNGSGKTNFLEFLDLQNKSSFGKNYADGQIPNFEATVSFLQKLKYDSQFENYLRKIKVVNTSIKNDNIPIRILKVNEVIEDNANEIILKKDYDLSTDGLLNFDVHYRDNDSKYYVQQLLSITYLTFLNPLYELLKNKLLIEVYREIGKETEILDDDGDIIEKETTYVQSAYIKNIPNGKIGFIDKIIFSIFFEDQLFTDELEISETINELKFSSLFLNSLKKYTPISDVAFDIDTITSEHEDSNLLILDNIFLLFFVNGKWLKWDNLSDGTKRMFYLFGNVFFSEKRKIILLEEPELGIHPDQLKKLMQFLKEQAKEKQIIITTHSPQVLNILSEDELDYIITTRYDAEHGTTMHHLTDTQKQVAHNYIEEGLSLGDAWVYSTQFEQATEEEEMG